MSARAAATAIVAASAADFFVFMGIPWRGGALEPACLNRPHIPKRPASRVFTCVVRGSFEREARVRTVDPTLRTAGLQGAETVNIGPVPGTTLSLVLDRGVLGHHHYRVDGEVRSQDRRPAGRFPFHRRILARLHRVDPVSGYGRRGHYGSSPGRS